MDFQSNLASQLKLTYSIPEAMLMLGMSRQTIYNLINASEIKSYTIGKRRYVSLEALIAFIKQKESEAA